jgi:UDP-N-acetylglucosamine 4,6-dehydratase
MTRFWITLPQGVQFVLDNLERMQGGELFVPKIPSMRVIDLAKVVAPQAEVELMGIRPGEKIHEEMISFDDARRTRDMGSYFVIQPQAQWWNKWGDRIGGTPIGEGFTYSSDKNDRWLGMDELAAMIQDV